jgi:hypothetical protein
MKPTRFNQQHFLMVLLFSTWFGLVTGFLEVIYWGFQKYLSHKLIPYSEHYLWMIPLAEALVFMMIGIGVYLLTKFLTESQSNSVLIFILIFVSLLSLFYVKPILHILAAIAFIAGIAFQGTRILRSRLPAFSRMVTKSLPVLGFTWGFLAIILIGGELWSSI